MEKLLTPSQASNLLAISSRQLRDLADSGEIAFVNVGQGESRPSRRYKPRDIEDFIARRTTMLSPKRGPSAPSSRAESFVTISEVLERRMEERRRSKEAAPRGKRR